MSGDEIIISDLSELKPAVHAEGLTWLLVKNQYLVMGRHRIAPGQEHPAKAHSDEDECLYVVEGTGVVLVGEKTEEVGAGSFVYVPRNTLHSMKNTGQSELEYLFFGAFTKSANG